MAGIYESPLKENVVSIPHAAVPSTSPKGASCENDVNASLKVLNGIPRGSKSPESRKPPETSRELLSHVAWMSDELLRASQEKVNLAQANHDMVWISFEIFKTSILIPKRLAARLRGIFVF